MVFADGKLVNLLTADPKPNAWLDLAGITYTSGDLLLAGGIPIDGEQPSTAKAVQVRRQQTLIFDNDGITTTLRTAAPTVGDALWEAGVRLHSSDIITPPVETIPEKDMIIHLQLARLLQVKLTGKEYSLYSPAKTVGAALAEAGLSLQGLDYSLPPEVRPGP